MPPAATSDARLVRRLLERDRAALAELCSLYGSRLYALGYRLTGKHDRAVELAVETVVRACSHLEEVDREQLDLSTYLTITATFVFLEHRDAPGALETDTGTPGSAWVWDDSERSVLVRREQDVLRLATLSLPATQRLVLALREVGELSYAEIASAVDLSESDVARTIADARGRLRVQLGLAEPRQAEARALCRMMLPLLSAHLDGETKDLRLDNVNEHLESCERCRHELDDIREIRRRYLALIPPAPDAELLERTELALTAIAFWSARPVIAFSRKRIAVAAVAVAVLAVLGASAALFAPSGETQRADLPAVAPPPPPKQSSTISLSCTFLPLGSVNSGSLAPGLAGESISVVYTAPSGSTTTHVQTTTAGGAYSDSFLMNKKGVWHVQSHWAGNSKYLPADSPACTLTVG